jgi:hypothetical protein
MDDEEEKQIAEIMSQADTQPVDVIERKVQMAKNAFLERSRSLAVRNKGVDHCPVCQNYIEETAVGPPVNIDNIPYVDDVIKSLKTEEQCATMRLRCCRSLVHVKCLIEHLERTGKNACPVCKGQVATDQDDVSELYVDEDTVTTPADVDRMYRDQRGANEEARSIVDLEALKARIESTRDAGDVQRANILQEHYDQIVAGRIGRTLPDAEEFSEESDAEEQDRYGWDSDNSMDRQSRSNVISISELSDSFRYGYRADDTYLWPRDDYGAHVYDQASLDEYMNMHAAKNAEYEEQESARPVTERPVDAMAFKSVLCTFWNCRTEPSRIFRLYAEWAFYEARILHPLCVFLIETFGFKTEDGSDDLKAAVKWVSDNIPHEDYTVDASNARLDVLYPGLKNTYGFWHDSYTWGELSHPMNPNGGFMNPSPILTFVHLKVHEVLTKEFSPPGLFIPKYRSEARLPRGIYIEYFTDVYVLREYLAAVIVSRGFRDLAPAVDHLKAIIHIKPNVGVEVKAAVDEFARTNTINDLAADLAVWQKELDKWDYRYNHGYYREDPDNKYNMWKTDRNHPYVYDQRSMEDYMYMHTVKGDDYEKLESSRPVTERPVDVAEFRSVLCTYWNCKTEPNRIFRLYAEWVFYEEEILISFCFYLIKTLGFEFVPYDYAMKEPDMEAAVGWIRDNVPHLDVSVEESNQRLDRFLEIFKESESRYTSLYRTFDKTWKEWDTITHPMNPNGGLQNRSPTRTYVQLKARHALSEKWDRLSHKRLPDNLEIDHFAEDGVLELCLAAIIVSERYNRLDLAITHLRETLDNAYGESYTVETKAAMAEFPRRIP